MIVVVGLSELVWIGNEDGHEYVDFGCVSVYFPLISFRSLILSLSITF
jgi:hypothetical protein